MGRLILIGGGMRSGKSRFAVGLAESFGDHRVFIATARATDDEMRERIQRHQAERAQRFRTVECPIELVDAVEANGNADVIVIDCLTLWIANQLELGCDNVEVLNRVDRLIGVALTQRATTVVVSNEVGMGLVSLSDVGRRFQDLTGWAHQRLVRAAAEVHVAIMGCVLRILPDPVTVMTMVRG